MLEKLLNKRTYSFLCWISLSGVIGNFFLYMLTTDPVNLIGGVLGIWSTYYFYKHSC